MWNKFTLFWLIGFPLCLPIFSHGQSLFEPVQIPSEKVPSKLKNASGIQFFTLKEGQLQQILRSQTNQLTFSLPGENGETKAWNLIKKPDATTGILVKTSGNKIYHKPIAESFHFGFSGKNELASLSILPNGIWGIFSYGKGNYNLVPTDLKAEGRPVYALFNDAYILEKPPFQCLVKEVEGKTEKPKSEKELKNGNGGMEECKKVRMYLECDHQMFLDNGQSVDQVFSWVTSMFQVVATLYFREGIQLQVSEVFIHTLPDQYPTSSSFDALDAFGDSLAIRPPQNSDLAHLLSTQNNSLGGVAYLDVLCDDFSNYAYSNIYNGFAPLPLYSWTVNVVAHELGHNFGSPHTQSCSWPLPGGSLGMLDSCYTPEGGCYSGPVVPIMGTIMSYCHLAMGVDLSKGFGPLPGALIRTRFSEATCLQGNVVLPILTISKPDTLCEGSSTTLSVTDVAGAGYYWTGPNGFNSTEREPVVTLNNTNQTGVYQVVVNKDGCESMPLKTSLRLDCIPFETDGDISLCPGQIVPISYEANFIPESGNQFKAEMSDNSGDFSNPTQLGVFASENQKGQFPVQIPGNLPAGNGYFIRLKSTLPTQTGQPFGPFSLGSPGNSANISNTSRCGPGILHFSGPENFSIRWFSDSLSGIPIATGNQFSTPVLQQDSIFWFESQEKTKAQVGPSTTNFTSSGGQLSNFTQGLYFRVNKDLVIDSVSLRAQGFGEVVFRVRDSANTKTIATVSRLVSGNLSFEKILIGIRLTPGTYRVDAIGSSVTSLYRNNDVTQYPFAAAGLMSITHATAANRYYWFYDWKISGLSCSGGRKKVIAQILPLPPTPLATADSVCHVGACVLQASGATGNQTYQWFSASGNAIPGANQPNFTTPLLTSTTNYQVSIRSGPNCESPKVLVKAIVNPKGPNLTPVSGKACMGQTIAISATANGPVSAWQWLTGNGNPIPGATSPSFSTLAITPDSSFQVVAFSPKGCPGDTISVGATGIPLPPTASGSDSSRCGPGFIRLKAEGALPGQHYHWYLWEDGLPSDTLNIGINGELYLPFDEGATYYATIAGNGHCESAVKNPIAAIVVIPPTTTTLSQNGNWLISSIDTVIQWYKNGVFLVSQGDSLDLSIHGDGVYQALILRANGCTSISEPFTTTRIQSGEPNIPLSLWPNPLEYNLHIETSVPGLKNLVISDVLGRIIESHQFSKNDYQIPTQQWPAGFYFVRVSSGGNHSKWFKMMKP